MIRDLLRRSPIYRPYVRWKLATSTVAREEHFTGFWRDNVWGDAESRSGSGSNLEVTAPLRAALPLLLRDLGVRSLLDVPCGDFFWMRHVDLTGVDYTGADIVGSMIDELNRDHSAANVRFVRLDVICDALPKTDAVMIRDLLLHLPTALVFDVLRNVRVSGAQFLIASTFTDPTVNVDVEMGHHRYLNLAVAPFSLPEPVRDLPDGLGDRPDKVLAVWRTSDLPA